MKSSKQLLFLSLVILFLLNISSAMQKKPLWINQRPVLSDYYIGIGAAAKSEGNLDYRQIAKENALQDLASEITVNISSEIVVKMMETSDNLEEDLKSQIRATTKANLEGYEQVDNWEDNDFYWVYYRLSRDTYAKNKKERINKARSLGMNLLEQGMEKEKAEDPAAALGYYVQALQAVEEFIGEPIKTEFAGSTIYLQNEIFNKLQALLSNISLEASNARLSGTVGRPVAAALTVKAAYADGKPVQNLPLYFQFIKGKGDILHQAQTNADGMANSRVTNIESTDKLQIIIVKVFPITEVISREHPLTAKLINNLTCPSARYLMDVSGITCFMEATERIADNTPAMYYVEPKLKKYLTDKGFTFTDNMADADILIKLEAVARNGAQVYNLYSSFADLNISVTNLDTGQEVYKNSFSGIKGIQLDYEKAGIEALKNAGKKIDEISAELISKLQ